MPIDVHFYQQALLPGGDRNDEQFNERTGVDANFKFLAINVGDCGEQSDGQIFSHVFLSSVNFCSIKKGIFLFEPFSNKTEMQF